MYPPTQMSMVGGLGIKLPHVEDLTFHGFDIEHSFLSQMQLSKTFQLNWNPSFGPLMWCPPHADYDPWFFETFSIISLKPMGMKTRFHKSNYDWHPN